MDVFEKFIETVVNFIRKYVVKFVVNKVLDWLWKKMKPKLLKIGRKLWQMLKDKLQKIQKKWMNFKQRKRASTAIPALTVMNEHCQENHSYEIEIMIIVTDKHIIVIVVSSLK